MQKEFPFSVSHVQGFLRDDVYVFHRQGRHREEENQNHQDRGPLWAAAEEGGVSEEPGEEEGEEEEPQL
jgi:hypothetical protein